MNITNRLFNEKSLEYAQREGYQKKQQLFDCILDGDLNHLEIVLNEYIESLALYVEGDLWVAKDSMRYVWAQMNAHVTFDLLSYEKARKIQEKYYFELELAENEEQVYTLCRSMSKELTEAIQVTIQTKTDSPLINDVKNYVQKHIYEKTTVQNIANEMNYSQSWISHKFKEETGITLEQYIRNEKVEEAKRLLATHISLVDIASMLRFASQSHFTDVFRRVEGMTPNRYRKLI